MKHLIAILLAFFFSFTAGVVGAPPWFKVVSLIPFAFIAFILGDIEAKIIIDPEEG